ncbi:hypothetical protein [Actinomadura hibisca]|uniref:hypothetical protein n=1 Tax=Actinomadura hibisca TaxID=68565 RepID=UPI0012F9B3A5|nr:hypothetical protein [Actinomadura hibisca]
MIEVADGHLAEVRRTLNHPTTTAQARHPATTYELARFTHVLIRYTDQIAAGFGTPYEHDTGIQDAARRAGALLRQAQELLGPPGWNETDGPQLAKHLRGTSLALGCGLDLLDTHITKTPDQGQVLSANAAVIAATDTARSLLHTLSQHAAAAGHVALRAGPEAHTAGSPLLNAALLTSVFGHEHPSGVTAIPFRHAPERLPPSHNEERSQLLAGIELSLQRLNADTTPSSVATWRYVARAAAIASDINCRLLNQLSRRAEELETKTTAEALLATKRAMGHNANKWRAVARKLHDLTDQHSLPVAGSALDAGDLVLRLGRLTFTDPAWRPHHTATTRLTPPEQIAPGPSDIRTVALTALKVTDTCKEIARRHHAATTDLATLADRTRGPDSRPAIPELNQLYENLQAAGERTLTELGEAIQHMAPGPPEQAADLALVQQRLTATRALATPQPTPAALASSSFPTPITKAITPVPTKEGTTNQPPRSAAPKGRSPR